MSRCDMCRVSLHRRCYYHRGIRARRLAYVRLAFKALLVCAAWIAGTVTFGVLLGALARAVVR